MRIEQAYRDLVERMGETRVMRGESMQKHTSFRIGGPADILAAVQSAEEIAAALEICKGHGIPVTVIGNGTNLLVRDKGIRGAVIKLDKGFGMLTIEGTRARAQAGLLLSALCGQTIQHGLAGLEFACGIPGSLGGAVVMNAGAYGGEIKDRLVSVVYMDENGAIGQKTAEACDFGYRHSVFSDSGDIVLEAEFELTPDENGQAALKAQELMQRRNAKQPVSLPSAGSTFKRPPGGYAAQMIEQAGLKGARVGGAQVSELHAGFIVNTGGATARDVLELVETVRTRVREAFGTELELEMKVIGEA